MTASQDAIRLLREQWAVNMSEELREVADSLPVDHAEVPGLIRAAEIVDHCGPSLPSPPVPTEETP